jgi:hypothetical protein
MAQILKLKDASAPWRKLIDAFRDEPQEGVVQDENNQVVAAVLPAQQYEAYQAYLRRREQNFGIIDQVREKMKGYDPAKIQADIDQAVEEVKAKYRADSQAT